MSPFFSLKCKRQNRPGQPKTIEDDDLLTKLYENFLGATYAAISKWLQVAEFIQKQGN